MFQEINPKAFARFLVYYTCYEIEKTNI